MKPRLAPHDQDAIAQAMLNLARSDSEPDPIDPAHLPDVFERLAQARRELATNATKYGALSNYEGRTLVRWRRQSNGGKLVLEWLETGGPQLTPPAETGYGTHVIRDIIPYELGGVVDFVLAPEGARCRLEIPDKWLRK